MNIFILDSDPVKAAEYHNDIHVSKMLLEACQMLCTAHHVLNPSIDIPYKQAHLNHPCSVWVRESFANYTWLLKLALNLALQYNQRFNKRHKCTDVVQWCFDHQYNINWQNKALTPFVQAMPDNYKNECPVKAYRAYYATEKRGFVRQKKYIPYTYTGVSIPSFMHLHY